MKKIISLVLVIAMLFLAGCGEQSKLSAMKKELQDDLFGVAFMGVCTGSYDDVKAYLNENHPEFEFVNDIDEEHFLQNTGYEIYLVIPKKGTVLTVETLDFNENYELVSEEVLGTFEDGKPLILRGNMAEFIPNLSITAENKNETESFSPVLSGMDGRLVTPEGNVKVWHLF